MYAKQLKKVRNSYQDTVKIFGLITGKPPYISHTSTFEAPEAHKNKYQELAAFYSKGGKLKDSNNRNEPHVVLSAPFEISDGMHVECKETDYATVQLYRTHLKKDFELITGNALLYCPETDEVILQKRSQCSDLYPGYYSLFGGGYLPSPVNDKVPDRNCIIQCISREFMEETGNTYIMRSTQAPLLVTKELSHGEIISGSIQFNALGVTISKVDAAWLEQTWEGAVKRIHRKELPKALKQKPFTPFAKVCIEFWLATEETSEPLYKRALKFIGDEDLGRALDNANKAADILKP